VLYFCNFLFYTDSGSLFFVLLSYYLSIVHAHWSSALAGIMSVVFRQTNIVWIGFVALSSILRKYDAFELAGHSKKEGSFPLFGFINFLLRNLISILITHVPYILVAGCFGIFLWKNGGNITVGDHENHAVSVNPVQPLYFLLFTLCAFFPSIALSGADPISFLSKLRRPSFFFIMAVIAIFITAIVHNSTFVHPFILADNRHYTFYIWKNIVRRFHWSKYAAVPVYCYALWAFKTELERKRLIMWGIFMFMALCAVLLPASLIEFRYYIIPCILLGLHFTVPSRTALTLELLCNIAVNAVTLYVFMWRPFIAPDGSVGRFMW